MGVNLLAFAVSNPLVRCSYASDCGYEIWAQLFKANDVIS